MSAPTVLQARIEHLSLDAMQGVEAMQANEYGELPIEHAPTIELQNNRRSVPQQFLSTSHTRSTIESIVLKINTPEGFLLFVGERNSELFLQVGIIGCENYPKATELSSNASIELPRKIVYGRRWLIEKTAPTSEVIQTANLAVKKAREHELREKIFVTTPEGGRATPFNCHLDLPLMASNPDLFSQGAERSEPPLEALLGNIRVSTLSVTLARTPIELDQGFVISLDLRLDQASEEKHFPDLENKRLQLFVSDLGSASVLHALLAELLNYSEQFVDANFAFDEFRRFDRSIDPLDIARFSISTRLILQDCDSLTKSHADFSYQIDSKRVPPFSQGELGARQRRRLLSERNLCGHLPQHD